MIEEKEAEKSIYTPLSFPINSESDEEYYWEYLFHLAEDYQEAE